MIILEGANICPYLGNIIMTKLNCVTYCLILFDESPLALMDSICLDL